MRTLSAVFLALLLAVPVSAQEPDAAFKAAVEKELASLRAALSALQKTVSDLAAKVPQPTAKEQAQRARRALEDYCATAGLTFRRMEASRQANAAPVIVCAP